MSKRGSKSERSRSTDPARLIHSNHLPQLSSPQPRSTSSQGGSVFGLSRDGGIGISPNKNPVRFLGNLSTALPVSPAFAQFEDGGASSHSATYEDSPSTRPSKKTSSSSRKDQKDDKDSLTGKLRAEGERLKEVMAARKSKLYHKALASEDIPDLTAEEELHAEMLSLISSDIGQVLPDHAELLKDVLQWYVETPVDRLMNARKERWRLPHKDAFQMLETEVYNSHKLAETSQLSERQVNADNKALRQEVAERTRQRDEALEECTRLQEALDNSNKSSADHAQHARVLMELTTGQGAKLVEARNVEEKALKDQIKEQKRTKDAEDQIVILNARIKDLQDEIMRLRPATPNREGLRRYRKRNREIVEAVNTARDQQRIAKRAQDLKKDQSLEDIQKIREDYAAAYGKLDKTECLFGIEQMAVNLKEFAEKAAETDKDRTLAVSHVGELVALLKNADPFSDTDSDEDARDQDAEESDDEEDIIQDPGLLRIKCKGLEQTIELKDAEILLKIGETELYRREVNQIQDVRKELEEGARKAQDDLAKLKTDSLKKQMDMKKRIDDLEMKSSEMNVQLDIKTREAASLVMERRKAEKAAEDMAAEINDVRGDKGELHAKIEELEGVIEGEKEKEEERKREMVLLKEQEAKAFDRLENMKDQRSQVADDLKRTERELEKVQAELDKSNKNVEALKKKLGDTQIELQGAEKDLSIARTQSQAAKKPEGNGTKDDRQLADAHEKIKHLEAKIQELQGSKADGSKKSVVSAMMPKKKPSKGAPKGETPTASSSSPARGASVESAKSSGGGGGAGRGMKESVMKFVTAGKMSKLLGMGRKAAPDLEEGGDGGGQAEEGEQGENGGGGGKLAAYLSVASKLMKKYEKIEMPEDVPEIEEVITEDLLEKAVDGDAEAIMMVSLHQEVIRLTELVESQAFPSTSAEYFDSYQKQLQSEKHSVSRRGSLHGQGGRRGSVASIQNVVFNGDEQGSADPFMRVDSTGIRRESALPSSPLQSRGSDLVAPLNTGRSAGKSPLIKPQDALTPSSRSGGTASKRGSDTGMFFGDRSGGESSHFGHNVPSTADGSRANLPSTAGGSRGQTPAARIQTPSFADERLVRIQDKIESKDPEQQRLVLMGPWAALPGSASSKKGIKDEGSNVDDGDATGEGVGDVLVSMSHLKQLAKADVGGHRSISERLLRFRAAANAQFRGIAGGELTRLLPKESVSAVMVSKGYNKDDIDAVVGWHEGWAVDAEGFVRGMLISQASRIFRRIPGGSGGRGVKADGAVDVMMSLGYSKEDSDEFVSRADVDKAGIISLDQWIQAFLRYLAPPPSHNYDPSLAPVRVALASGPRSQVTKTLRGPRHTVTAGTKGEEAAAAAEAASQGEGGGGGEAAPGGGGAVVQIPSGWAGGVGEDSWSLSERVVKPTAIGVILEQKDALVARVEEQKKALQSEINALWAFVKDAIDQHRIDRNTLNQKIDRHILETRQLAWTETQDQGTHIPAGDLDSEPSTREPTGGGKVMSVGSSRPANITEGKEKRRSVRVKAELIKIQELIEGDSLLKTRKARTINWLNKMVYSMLDDKVLADSVDLARGSHPTQFTRYLSVWVKTKFGLPKLIQQSLCDLLVTLEANCSSSILIRLVLGMCNGHYSVGQESSMIQAWGLLGVIGGGSNEPAKDCLHPRTITVDHALALSEQVLPYATPPQRVRLHRRIHTASGGSSGSPMINEHSFLECILEERSSIQQDFSDALTLQFHTMDIHGEGALEYPSVTKLLSRLIPWMHQSKLHALITNITPEFLMPQAVIDLTNIAALDDVADLMGRHVSSVADTAAGEGVEREVVTGTAADWGTGGY